MLWFAPRVWPKKSVAPMVPNMQLSTAAQTPSPIPIAGDPGFTV